MNNRLMTLGFTLLECLVTLMIMAIFALIAVFNGGTWLIQQQSKTVIDQLVHDLQFARQQALLRKTTINLCPTVDFLQCTNSTAWENGYLLVDKHNEILSTTRITSNGNLSNSREYVQFAADGFTNSTNSTFVYKTENKEYRVIINLQGRIRVEE